MTFRTPNNPSPRKQRWIAYMRTPAWRTLSNACLERDGHKCQLCGGKNKTNPTLHAHHHTYPDDFADDGLHNLVTLCASCHNNWHVYYDRMTKNKSEDELQRDKPNEITDFGAELFNDPVPQNTHTQSTLCAGDFNALFKKQG